MKNKAQGIQMGIACLIFGIFFSITNIILYNNGKVSTTLLATAPMLILSGIVFLLMPGVNPPAEIRDNQRVKYWWKNSPRLNKVIWIVTMLVGFSIGVYLLFTFTDFAS